VGIRLKPKINKTDFGSITIDGVKIDHDVIIRLDGQVKKRKKKLSKAVYGTSHKISLDEAKYVYEKGVNKIIIGSGQTGMVKLSEEAAQYFDKKNCKVKILPTPDAIQLWNDAKKGTIGLFHITC
jgi:hypothetical protein